MSASVQTADEAPASETVTPRGRTALRALLPDRVTGSTRLLAWCTLAVHIGIVVTGGLVRLTGSGLGCPTWPSCTEDSFVPTPEMGVHGVIEFGNRTLTGVLCVVALLTLLAVLRTRGGGRRLLGPAVWIGVLTLVQAVVGGVTVLVDLHPGAVGIHMLISMGLVSIASVLLVRVLRDEPAPRRPLRRALREHRAAAIAAVLVWTWTWITVFVGALTTGSGPHAGDAAAARNGLPPELMQHLHSYPAYVLLGCTLLLIVSAADRGLRPVRRAAIGLLLLLLVQTAVGIWQSRTGLPVELVAVHMGLGTVSVCLATVACVLLFRAAPRSAAEA